MDLVGFRGFFYLNDAKPFYLGLMFNGLVTLIHVTNEASESFCEIHSEFLWQEE